MQTADAIAECLIRKMFDTIDIRRWDDLGQCFTVDVVYERPGYEPLFGLDALDHFYRAVRIIASGEHQIERLIAYPDAAACWGRFVGADRNGRPLNERFSDVYELRNGLVARRVTHFFRPAI
jgi:uncharacterized protein